MLLTVLKSFPHPSRRFSAGDQISEADAAGGPLSLDELKSGRFVAGAENKAATDAVKGKARNPA